MKITSIIIIIATYISANHFFSVGKYDGPISDHFDGKHFHNLGYKGHTILSRSYRLKTFLTFAFKKLDRNIWKVRKLSNGQTKPVPRVMGREIVATFVNHSTVLIQTEGINILTDPIWAKRASPLSFGEKRYVDPGVAINDLPEIDIILLSHDHYDHMDTKTLKKIVDRDKSKIYTPLGNSKFLVKKGIYSGIDMDTTVLLQLRPNHK